MTTLELENRKQNLIEALTSFDNEEAVAQMEQLVARLKKRFHKAPLCPCAFTVEEMRDELTKAKNNPVSYSHEEALEMIKGWK